MAARRVKRKALPSLSPRRDEIREVSVASVKLRGEQTRLPPGQQFHPANRRGGPRLGQLPRGGDALSAGAERLSAFRPCEVDLPQLPAAAGVRRPLPSALRR